MGLVTTEIDEDDPQYVEYCKVTEPDNRSWLGYQIYCGEQFEIWMGEQLTKHKERNSEFLWENGYKELFIWLRGYEAIRPKSMSREDMPDYLFNIHLKLGGCYNGLMMEFAHEELDEKDVKLRFERINEYKKILDNYGK